MARSVVLVSMLVVAFIGSGCHGGSTSPKGQQLAAARLLCNREAQGNRAGDRGTLVGAFPTTIRAVESEIRREYKDRSQIPKLVSRPEDQPLALCYYDATEAQRQVQPDIERIGLVVDQKLNSFLLYAGPKSKVPVRAIS